MIENADRRKGVLAAALLLALLLVSVPPASASIDLEESQSSIVATGDHLRVEISKAFPSITFSDPNGDGEIHRLEFVRMIAFNSTNGGYYERKGQQFSANLSDAVWQTSSGSSQLPGGGTLLTINMTAVLDFQPAKNATSGQQGYGGQGSGQGPAPTPISDAVRLTFTYRMASRNMSYQFGGYQFTLKNDSEMKILIKIEMLASIPAGRLCIEQALIANNGADYGGGYRLYDGTGVHEVDGSVNETSGGQPITHQYTTRTQIQQRIAYESSDGKESGFYDWVPLVERHDGGTVTNSTMDTSYGTDGSSLRLFCSFAMASTGTTIMVDPTIGTVISEIINYLISHVVSIGIGALVGSAILITLLAYRRRGYAREDPSASTSLEENPFYVGEKMPPNK